MEIKFNGNTISIINATRQELSQVSQFIFGENVPYNAFAKVEVTTPSLNEIKEVTETSTTLNEIKDDAEENDMYVNPVELAKEMGVAPKNVLVSGIGHVIELTGLEPETLYCVPPVVNDPNDPLVRDLVAAMKRNWGPTFRDTKMVAATDAFQFSDLALPTVIYCPDAHGAHQDDEHGSLKSAAEYLDFFIAWLSEKGKTSVSR